MQSQNKCPCLADLCTRKRKFRLGDRFYAGQNITGQSAAFARIHNAPLTCAILALDKDCDISTIEKANALAAAAHCDNARRPRRYN